MLEDWISERKEAADLKVEKLPIKSLKCWSNVQGRLKHETGGFFSVIGLVSRDKSTNKILCQQPIIDQPQIGILGFLFAKDPDGIKILLQAKTEPGNINGTQIGPTVQATYSNYMRLHDGEPTKFLEYFIQNNKLKFQGTLQSEQGTRFFGKYNRNISVFIDSSSIIENEGNWCWFSLNEVLNHLNTDFLINTDSRSVLICADWRELNNGREPFITSAKGTFGSQLYESFISKTNDLNGGIEEITKALQNKRNNAQFEVVQEKLDLLDGWIKEGREIRRDDLFSVIGLSISVKGREVSSWDQPIVQSNHEGEVILYCKQLNGVLHFLVSYSPEIGFKEKVQFGPSIQKLDKSSNIDIQLNTSKTTLIDSYLQSDEGGRFYQSVVKYSLVKIDEDEEVKIGDSHIWMTLNQIYQLMPNKGFFTNEFRSVLSLILKYL